MVKSVEYMQNITSGILMAVGNSDQMCMQQKVDKT